jgi:predicted amidohydrolase YtcJ
MIVLFAMLSATCNREATVPTARSAPTPALILVNARVFTADIEHPYAEAIAIEDGRFAAVGTNAQVRRLAGPATRIIDVGGRLVTPGLIEAHAHFDMPPPGRLITPPHVPYPGPGANETLASVAKAAQAGPGWISGVTDAVFNDSRNWRHALDAVAPNNPVMLTGWSSHAMLLNSRALEALGIADGIADPIGGHWGRDASSRLNGQADEAAETMAMRRAMAADPDRSLEAKTLRQGAAAYARWGVTTVHHMADELPLASVRAALDRAHLPIKWTVYAWGLPQAAIADAWREVDADGGVWPPRTRLGGSKWVLDGSPLERGAFLLEDYADRPGWRGRSNYSEAQLREILSGALTSRHQVALHTVGDAEAEMLLHIMGDLAPASRWRSLRVRIEHGEGIFGERLTRVAALGIVIDQQPIHLAGLKVEGGQLLQDARWGARADHFAPLRSLLAAGIPLAFSSDSNDVDETANPFLNIMIAVSYPRRPDEALTREQALMAYTAGGAYAEREETRKGRIMRGMAADLAVLSQDILAAPLDALPATTSLLTVVDGAIIAADGPFAALGATPVLSGPRRP